MLDTPAISVVIPTYNAAKFLREALDSLLAQTFTNWEAVCVNDGSTDNSLEILQEYAARDSRFRILDGPNGGYGKAMNRGMDAAAGKYLAILEPDDFLPPHAYEALHRLAESHHLEVVRGTHVRFYQDGNSRKYEYNGTTSPLGQVIAPKEYPAVFYAAPQTWVGLYNMDYIRLNEVRYNESPGASYQDTGFFIQTLATAQRAMLTDDIVYMYRIDNPNSSINTADSKVPLFFGEFDHIRKKLEQDPELWATLKKVYTEKFFGTALWFCTRLQDHAKREFLGTLREKMITLKPLEEGGISEYARRSLSLILQAPEAYLAHEALKQEAVRKLDCIQQQMNALPMRDTPFIFRSSEKIAYRFLYIPLVGKYNTAELTRWSLFGIPVICRHRCPLYATPIPGCRVVVAHEDVYSIFGCIVKRKPLRRSAL